MGTGRRWTRSPSAPTVDHPRRVFDEPDRYRVVQRDLLLDVRPEIQIIGPQDARDLLHGGLDLHIPRWFVRVGMLLHDLLQLVGLGRGHSVPAEEQDSWHVVGPQRQLSVTQPHDDTDESVDGVVVRIRALLKHYVREDNLAE